MGGGVSDDSVKVCGGVAAGVGANAVGIPLDRFRIMVAQDSSFSRSLLGHWRETVRSLGAAYTGGIARVAMKGTASTLNLLIPHELRQQSPFTASFFTGLFASPVFNVPRMLQMAKINGERYPAAAHRLFTTAQGLRTYAHNTALFAPGEGLRMMLCFGSKDFLVPFMKPHGQPCSEAQVAARAATLAMLIGPTVAMVESTASLATETASTVHAKLGTIKQAAGIDQAGAAALRAEALSATVNPRYIARCFVSLTSKNIVCNTATFFFMFLADEYIALLRAKEGRLRRRSTFDELSTRLQFRLTGSS
ncbi:hypothetical protein KFE25_008668 [Diacronema lutheri]|uniref:Uncharacterized protein n=1 Tax=Diacronema lutheri TaxID=2081491 RepID=A0A8J5XX14_DIALT|nr:hypothetical protein KFE25_008668 [Diacronema lutheri]